MINNITKTAYEKFPIYADFSHEIVSGDSISSQTLICVNTLTGGDTKATIIDSHAISSDQILIVIKAGTARGLHHITSKIVTANEIKAECDIFLSIKELTNDSFKKQPSEEFNIQFDFEGRVGPESIDSKTVIATKISDGSDATSTVIDFSEISGDTVIVGVKAGTDDESYLISSRVVTDISSYQLENIIRMDVIEK
jgi:hypothetical protein